VSAVRGRISPKPGSQSPVLALLGGSVSAPLPHSIPNGEEAVRAAVSASRKSEQKGSRHSLGTGGTTVPEGQLSAHENQDSRGSTVVKRWSLLEKIQRLCRPKDKDTRGPAVCGCGRPADSAAHVNIHYRGDGRGGVQAGVSGVFRCDSPWLCPVCARRLALKRMERVLKVTQAAYARGGAAAMVALTAYHGKSSSLAGLKSLIQQASGKARKGRAWRDACREYGILGVVVGQEVELGEEHGWHYHQHLAVVIDGPTDAEYEASDYDDVRLEQMIQDRAFAAGRWLEDAYVAQIHKSGCVASRRNSCKTHVAHDAEKAAGYTAKGSMAWGVDEDGDKADVDTLTPWDIALEAADGDQNAARTKYMRAKWSEYQEAMPGTRSCVVSASLAKKLGIGPDTQRDAEDGDFESEPEEQQHHERGQVIGTIEAAVWSRWMNYRLASTFLRRVEWGGAGGFSEAVRETEADSDIIATKRNEEASAALNDRLRAEAEEAMRRMIQQDQRDKAERREDVARYERAIGQRGHSWDIKNGDAASVAMIAGERLRRHESAIGQRSRMKPIIDDLAATYGVRLAETEVLNAASSATDLMRHIESICEGRWLSEAEVAAMDVLAA